MKKTFKILIVGLVAVFMTACGSAGKKGVDDTNTSTPTPTTSEDIPTVKDSTNDVAEIHIKIKDVTTSSISSQIFGEDGDGINHVDVYVIDVYKSTKESVFVVGKKTKKFNSTTDVVFDYKVEFDNLYPDKEYIIRAVAYTVNGIKVTEEKVGTNAQVKTEPEPTPTPEPAPAPEPAPTPEKPAPTPEKPAPTPEPVNARPTCESFTVNALGDPTFTTSVASKIHDADGDSLTVKYIEVVKLTGDLIFDMSNTGISGTNATITIANGSG